MPILTVSRGPDRGKQIRVVPGQSYVIGSDPSASLVLSDPKVLDKHCTLAVENGRVSLVNLTASAGTFMGDKKIDKADLAPGGTFRVGDTLLTLKGETTPPTSPPNAPKAPASTENEVPDALVGKIVGGYHLREVVGRGGMGTVYRATQLSLNRDVAVKILAAKYSSDAAFRDLFINEARAAGQLIHPNVVQVFDAGTEGAITYFSMEFMAFGSVEEVLAREGKIPWERAILMLLDAAHGLDFADKKQIVHRDIKPDNLMMNEDGRVKIADLGLAKRGEGRPGAEETGIIGTPHFMAPEQALGKSVDHRADLYSLGATFFRMITGRTLFNGKTAKEIVLRHIKEPPPAASELADGIPGALDLVLARLLAKDPDQRTAHAQDLIKALEEICAHHGIKGAVIRRGVPKRVLIPILALLVAALGAAGYFLFIKQPDPAERLRREEAERKAQEARLDAERTERGRIEAERLRRQGEARIAFGKLELAQAKITPGIDDTYDDPLEAAQREAAWREIAAAYREFAESPPAREFSTEETDRTTAAPLHEKASEQAQRIEDRLAYLKATAEGRRKWIEGRVALIRSRAKEVEEATARLVSERRYGAAIHKMRGPAEGKPEAEDPFLEILKSEWVSPDGKERLPAERRKAITDEVEKARKAFAEQAKRLLPAAAKDWEATSKRADELRRRDEAGVQEAIQLLQGVEERFPAPDAPPIREITELVAKATSLRAELEAERARELERRLAEDREKFRRLRARIQTLSPVAQFNYVMDARFSKALEEIEQARRAALTEEYRAQYEAWQGRVRWMAWLFLRFRAGLQASLDRKQEGAFSTLDLVLDLPAGPERETPEKVPGAFYAWPKEPEGPFEDFAFRRKFRSNTEIYRLGEFPMDWVYTQVFLVDGKPRWSEVGPELEFALAVFCHETCQFAAAQHHFEALAGDATYGAAASQLAESCAREGKLLAEYVDYLRARTEERTSAEMQRMRGELAKLAERHPLSLLILDILPTDEPHKGTLPAPARLPPLPP
ncbi:MAG: protein kinase domain-containing protein [Planctomycetaceae bacterium]